MKRFFSLLASSTLLLNTPGASYAQDAIIPSITKKSPEKPVEKTPVVAPKVEAVKPVEVAKPVAIPKVETPIVANKVAEKVASSTKPVEKTLVVAPAKIEVPKVEAVKPVEVAKPVAIPKVETPIVVNKVAEKVASPTKPVEKTPVVAPKVEVPKVEAVNPVEVAKLVEKVAVSSENPTLTPTLPPEKAPTNIEAVKPVEVAKPVAMPKVETPIVANKVSEKVASPTKPVEKTPVVAPAKIEAVKPVEVAKLVEKVAVSSENPTLKPTLPPEKAPTNIEAVKPVEVAKPVAIPKVEAPKVETVKPVVAPVKIEAVKPVEVAKPVAISVINPNVEVVTEKRLSRSDFNEARKDDRKALHNKKEERDYGKTMENIDLDSDLILKRYDSKQFIKTKIEEVAKTVVQKEIEAKKTIADQMGAFGSKKISVSIDETVSIKDAIMEVSNLAGIDIEIDPSVEGAIILSVKNTKAADVLERMAELAQLNISVRENVVRFTANKPFTKNYNISFIDSMNAAVNNAQSTSSGVGNQNTNTNPYINQSFNGNLNGSGGMNGGMTGGINGIAGQNNNGLYNSSMNINNPSMWVEFENGLKYIVSQKKDTLYSINKQAGIVTLRAPLIIQKEVEEYIDRVKKVATAQILVEVRLVEVQLNDEFATGINFSSTGSTAVSAPFSATSTAGISLASPFAITIASGGLSAAVQFLQTFGTTKAIASPRLNVMNNQKSKLSFAKDYVYFSLQPQLQNSFTTVTGATSTATNPIIVQSTIHTIPVGIILDLQATADIDKNEVTMNIHPVLSSVSTTISDPAASFLSTFSSSNTSSASITNSIPIIEKKELNSTLRIKSGEIMVVGGFNEEKTIVSNVGIPYLKDIPYLGVLFGRSAKSVNNVETVIFIKATIMQPETSISEDDTKFYNDFA